MDTLHTYNAPVAGRTLALMGYFDHGDYSVGIQAGAFVVAVDGVDIGAELPSCPFSEASRPETERVLAAAGVPAGVSLDDLCAAWLRAHEARP